jgi:hypothetical protein
MTRLKALWATLESRYNTLPRVVQIVVIGLGFGAIALVINTAVVSFYNYRTGIQDQIDANRDRAEQLQEYIARAEEVERERNMLAKRLEGLRSRFVPGDTGTLAAAHLQDHVTTVASDTGVNVQSAQVMREEKIGSYRQVTVRLTLRATIKALSGFLETLEYGTMQLSVPFLQIDRRGGATRRRSKAQSRAQEQKERVLSATLEVRGFAGTNMPKRPPDGETEGEPDGGTEGVTGGATGTG